MINKKLNVLDRLKKDSFKKKNENNTLEIKEFQITAVEKEIFNSKDILFDYNSITDENMKIDLLNYENLLIKAQNNYHTQIGKILLEANNKYSNNKNGIFGLWLNYMKIGKKNAERLINRYLFIIQNIKTKEDLLYFESLPLSLTYEVSIPSAPKELIDAVLSKEIKTRKEFIQLKKSISPVSQSNFNQIENINTLLFNLNSNLNTLIKTNHLNIDNSRIELVSKKINSLNEEIIKLLDKSKI